MRAQLGGNDLEHLVARQVAITIIDTLEIGWDLHRMLPREELDRIDTKILDVYYDKKDADTDSDKKQA